MLTLKLILACVYSWKLTVNGKDQRNKNHKMNADWYDSWNYILAWSRRNQEILRAKFIWFRCQPLKFLFRTSIPASLQLSLPHTWRHDDEEKHGQVYPARYSYVWQSICPCEPSCSVRSVCIRAMRRADISASAEEPCCHFIQTWSQPNTKIRTWRPACIRVAVAIAQTDMFLANGTNARDGQAWAGSARKIWRVSMYQYSDAHDWTFIISCVKTTDILWLK